MVHGRVATLCALVVAVALAAGAAAGCAAPLTAAAGPGSQGDANARVAAFQTVEDDVLHELAALDRRVASRGRIDPREGDLRRSTMAAVLAEDKTLAAIDGAIDSFSFEARARGLASVKTRLASAPTDLPASAAGKVTAPSFEKELLARLVVEETVRLDEERALPRSGSALVRGIVETWQAPATAQQAAERDRWLARRLTELLATVANPGALDVVRARELDDALDALERHIEAAGLARSTAELVKLREALEGHAARPAAGAVSDWSDVARGVRAHLGIGLPPDALEARLAAAEKRLRVAADAAMAAARVAPEMLSSHAAPLVMGSGPCAVVVPGSRVRSMAPPPERIAACRLRQAVASAGDDASRALALVAMHDHVVVAQWALDVARGQATIAQTTGRHRPMSLPGPDVVARWERLALARPASAIGGGLAADLLFASGDAASRARAWAELGEVPLDIAERELSAAVGGR